MTSITTKRPADQLKAETAAYLFDDWFDPIEAGLRDRVRAFIETMIRSELDAALARPRYGRRPDASEGSDAGLAGHRHGSRTRSLTGGPSDRLRSPFRGLGSKPEMARRQSGRARHCGLTSVARWPPTR